MNTADPLAAMMAMTPTAEAVAEIEAARAEVIAERKAHHGRIAEHNEYLADRRAESKGYRPW